MDTQVKRGSLEMIAAMTISGTIGWCVVGSGQPVLAVVFWRCLFGAGALLLVCAALGLLRRLDRRTLALAAASGAAIVGNWLLLFAAYRHASIGVSTAVYNSQPFMLVLLGALVLKERLEGLKLAWLGLSFLGMLAIVSVHGGSASPGGHYLLGIALALGAAALYALAALVVKRLSGTPPHLIALIQVLTGILLLAPFVAFQPLPRGPVAWGLLGLLGVVHTGLMYILLYGAIQRLPTVLVGSLGFIYPIVAILVDGIAFGHRLLPVQWVGAAAILLAAAGLQLGWGRHGWEAWRARAKRRSA